MSEEKSSFYVVEDPKIARVMFDTTKLSWLWLILRVYIGYQWLTSGWEKLQSPAWMQGGKALEGFWKFATAVDPNNPHPAVAYGWYRAFLQFLLDSQSFTWFAKMVAVGEFLIGIALIIGMFTGIAAFFAGFLNWNFMMAGSAGVNPLMFLITILLILAWKVAGYYGVDRWLLPKLGTPWKPGPLVSKEKASS
jgi:thiosulfate dehydrogenase [quinone] large subunit